MPSKTKKQARFMQAVAHGFQPKYKKGPSVKVAKEFLEADRREGKYQGKKRKYK
jgi:hypothetical protein